MQGKLIPVLDHGYVQLIDSMGSDATIIEAARMSTGRGFEGWDPTQVCETCGYIVGVDNPAGHAGCDDRTPHTFRKTIGDSGLLEFLYSNQHMTPFEMCELCIEVKAPIFVFREWHRHRTQSYNEFSARYSKMPNEHYLPELSRFQKQSLVNKQSSEGTFDEELAKHCQDTLGNEQDSVYVNYDQLVEMGLAKEVARINTPVSRYSKMRAKTDLRNWLSFLLLRMRPSAQWEIRQFANVVGDIIRFLWPRTYALFMEYTFEAMQLSATEKKVVIEISKCVYPPVLQEMAIKHLGPKRAQVFLTKLNAA